MTVVRRTESLSLDAARETGGNLRQQSGRFVRRTG